MDKKSASANKNKSNSPYTPSLLESKVSVIADTFQTKLESKMAAIAAISKTSSEKTREGSHKIAMIRTQEFREKVQKLEKNIGRM